MFLSRIMQLSIANYVRPGDTVVCAQMSAEPLTLTEALVAQADAAPTQFAGVTAFIGACYADTFDPTRAPALGYLSYGALANAGRLSKARRIAVAPAHYSNLANLFTSGAFKADVVLLQASRARDGRRGMGAAHGYMLAAARRARVVLVEENAVAPFCLGAEFPDDLAVAATIHTNRPLPQLAPPSIGAVEAQIGARIAALVPQAATLQVGLGSIPDAALAALSSHRGLRLHSGMLTEAALPLIESGAVEGAIVTGSVTGTDRLYAWAHENPQLRLVPVGVSHGAQVLTGLPRFTAINSAIEVDLLGNVNSEVAAGVYVGGTGGAVDFVRGAAASAGGRAIIALPSSAKRGTISRIVAKLSGPTTIGAVDADTFVTEHGVATLTGCSQAERARRMIALAEPALREKLAEEARGMGFFG